MVEVDDQAEWDFLLDFIDTHGGFDKNCSYNGDSGYVCPVYLGVRDTNTPDKTFHFLQSELPMSFTVWADGWPVGGNNDCVVIAPFGRKMYDVLCFLSSWTARTVCELDDA